MDRSGHREHGRHKPEQYKSILAQHQMKDQAMKLMAIIAERDRAIQDRELALCERKAAFAERDKAIVDLNGALAELNKAIIERDNAIAALESAHQSGLYTNSKHGCPNMNQRHPPHVLPVLPQLSNAPYDPSKEAQITDALPISVVPQTGTKGHQVKRAIREVGAYTFSPANPSKSLRKRRKCGSQVPRGGEDLNVKHEWKDQDLGLNQVTFDESTMPPPVCSCTGFPRQCYKWGSGGWQSSCCTTTLSEYPLPVAPNKKHARIGGRKMSGSAFNKLLSRLAAEGHDLSTPVDLRDHWARHGTNRYITIR